MTSHPTHAEPDSRQEEQKSLALLLLETARFGADACADAILAAGYAHVPTLRRQLADKDAVIAAQATEIEGLKAKVAAQAEALKVAREGLSLAEGDRDALMPIVAGIRMGREYTQVDVAPILNWINERRDALTKESDHGR